MAPAASYWHMHQLAARHGELWLSWIMPLSVDGLIVVASLAIAQARLTGIEPPKLAWWAVWTGILVSLAANVAAGGDDWVSRLVAAWRCDCGGLVGRLVGRGAGPGQAREAERGNGYSLHATFGFVKRTGVDWLSWVADRSREREIFRLDLDRWGTPESQEAEARRLLWAVPAVTAVGNDTENSLIRVFGAPPDRRG